MPHPLPLLLLASMTAPAAEPVAPFHFAYYLSEDAHGEDCGACHAP